MSLSIIGGPLHGNRYYQEQVYPYIQSLPESVRSRIVIHDRQSAEVAHAAGDVFVGASTWETWFLSLTEAMASGNACLVSDKPILREVAGDNIPIVDEADFNSIARSMYNFAVDTNYRFDVAQHAYRRGQRYTWKASVARLSLVLDNLQKGA
jgi:glycosyltransferase involved in cell wall biosynthesis